MITLKAYAKINLGLDVLGKLDNGYHIVKMIMQSIDLYDELSFSVRNDGKIVITASDPGIPTANSNPVNE